jgi:RNA polymerase sigma factor for flagellar operon FliA
MSVDEQIQQEVSLEQNACDTASLHAGQFIQDEHLAHRALKTYGSNVSRQKEDEKIIQYIPLVHRIVSQVTSYLNMPLSKDDLVSAGTIGLVKAARDFDPTKDAEFKTYAYIRVRGAIIDELRGWSFTPPRVKKLINQAQEISENCYNEHGSLPSDEEVAEKMGIDEAKLGEIYETARARHFISIYGLNEDSPALGQFLAANVKLPDIGVEREELKMQLARAIKELPEKHRQVILLYYHRELTMKQVSEVMELTEPRVSQLHAAALFKLSVRLKHWNNEE